MLVLAWVYFVICKLKLDNILKKRQAKLHSEVFMVNAISFSDQAWFVLYVRTDGDANENVTNQRFNEQNQVRYEYLYLSLPSSANQEVEVWNWRPWKSMADFSCLPFDLNAFITYLAWAGFRPICVQHSSTLLGHSRVQYEGVVLGVTVAIDKNSLCDLPGTIWRTKVRVNDILALLATRQVIFRRYIRYEHEIYSYKCYIRWNLWSK